MKNAQISDVAIFVFWLFFIIVAFYVMYYFVLQIRVSLLGIVPQESIDVADDIGSSFQFADKIIPIAIIVFVLILINSTEDIKINKQFWIISVIGLGFVVIGAGMVSNFIDKFVNSTEFSTVKGNLPIMTRIGLNLPFFAMIVGFLFLFGLYAKGRFGGSSV